MHKREQYFGIKHLLWPSGEVVRDPRQYLCGYPHSILKLHNYYITTITIISAFGINQKTIS